MIYLAGPHTQHAWQQEFLSALHDRGGATLVCFDPIAAFGQVKDANVCAEDCRKINAINRAAIRVSDLVVANLSYGVTLGTARDMEHAAVFSIPTVIVCGERFPKYDAMVAAIDLKLVPCIEDAAALAIRELL